MRTAGSVTPLPASMEISFSTDCASMSSGATISMADSQSASFSSAALDWRVSSSASSGLNMAYSVIS